MNPYDEEELKALMMLAAMGHKLEVVDSPDGTYQISSEAFLQTARRNGTKATWVCKNFRVKEGR